MSNQTFFVTGATGPQGGAVARHLLKKNCTVHAITRNIDSPAAKELQKLGVKLFVGELDNEEPLKAGMQGCTGLFLNLPPNPTTTEPYAKCILPIAKSAGIKHVVYSTAIGANNPEKFAAWKPNGMIEIIMAPKRILEEVVRNYGFEYWTILRPGNFMANFTLPKLPVVYPGLDTTGVFKNSFGKETLIPMIDHDDIGKFGAAALLDPSRFDQHSIELVSELLTVDQIVAELSKATIKKISAHYLSDEEFEVEAARNSPASWHKMLRDLGQFVDMDKLRTWGIPLNSFADFLQREKDIVTNTYAQVPSLD
ncbi:hypothetical protein PISL3812_06110 [Talaromyces islandicus]|uniref:NmrA-like domain-containing protein n=1 Tax=Talaromyces islandicus TaxID=28573 RepID=A0A0U1M0H7_TALIS|nr:hypothetical protein PISL3812_06110 [Talaromyces islandicus]